MIEFNGKLTCNANEYALKKVSKKWQILIVVCAICSLPTTIMLVIMTRSYFSLFAPFTFLLLSFFPAVFKNSYEASLPDSVVIDKDEGTIEFDFYRAVRIIPFEKIKVIRDCGDFYEITTANLFEFNALICQKDLLTKGTLEDFEAIFDEKT